MLQWLAKLESTFCNGHHKACPSYHFLATLGGPLHSIERSLVPPRHLIHVTSWTNIYSKSKSIKYLQHQANKLHKECHNRAWYMNEKKSYRVLHWIKVILKICTNILVDQKGTSNAKYLPTGKQRMGDFCCFSGFWNFQNIDSSLIVYFSVTNHQGFVEAV